MSAAALNRRAMKVAPLRKDLRLWYARNAAARRLAEAARAYDQACRDCEKYMKGKKRG